MITTEKLLKAGYKPYVGNQKFSDSEFCVGSWQKTIRDEKGNKKFFIDFNVYDFSNAKYMPEHLTKNFQYDSKVQFENGETFDVSFFIRDNHEIEDVENFYERMFQAMNCLHYDIYN